MDVVPGHQDGLHLAVLLRLQVALLSGNVLQQSFGLSPAFLKGDRESAGERQLCSDHLGAHSDHTVAGSADLLGYFLASRVGSCLLDYLLLESALLHRPLLTLLSNGDQGVGALGQVVRDIRSQVRSQVSAGQTRRSGSSLGVFSLATSSELNLGHGNWQGKIDISQTGSG